MKWVVNANGPVDGGEAFTYVDPDVGGSSIELSVVRDDNQHGKESLGWGGPQKYIISYLTPLPPKWLLDSLWSVAEELADKLNAIDAEYIPTDWRT